VTATSIRADLADYHRPDSRRSVPGWILLGSFSTGRLHRRHPAVLGGQLGSQTFDTPLMTSPAKASPAGCTRPRPSPRRAPARCSLLAVGNVLFLLRPPGRSHDERRNQPSPVPEPGSLPLLFTGLMGGWRCFVRRGGSGADCEWSSLKNEAVPYNGYCLVLIFSILLGTQCMTS